MDVCLQGIATGPGFDNVILAPSFSDLISGTIDYKSILTNLMCSGKCISLLNRWYKGSVTISYGSHNVAYRVILVWVFSNNAYGLIRCLCMCAEFVNLFIFHILIQKTLYPMF